VISIAPESIQMNLFDHLVEYRDDGVIVDFDAIRARSYAVGDLVRTAGICGTREDNGSQFYCYMETIRLVEEREDGRWIGVIDMGLVHGTPWSKDGTRLVLTVDGMEPANKWAWRLLNGQA